MDPNETFALFMKALRSNDADELKEHGYCLVKWIERGGFAPTVNQEDFRTILFELLFGRTIE